MSEIEIDLAQDDAEEVETTVVTKQPRRRWCLRDIQIDPESRNITVRFYGAINGKVVHKSRCLSIGQDPETMQESGFWLDNEKQIKAFCKKILQALRIQEVQ